MNTAGIKEIKNNLSRYLARVKQGEEILITERGKPIARIVKEDKGNRSIYAKLKPLVGDGLIVLPCRSLDMKNLKPLKIRGKLVSEMVVEDRR
jgi:prevent-host-death family protein